MFRNKFKVFFSIELYFILPETFLEVAACATCNVLGPKSAPYRFKSHKHYLHVSPTIFIALPGVLTEVNRQDIGRLHDAAD